MTINHNHHNYLHQRQSHHNQAEYDRAILRTLIALVVICLIAMAADRAFGQDEPKTLPSQAQAQPQPKSQSQPQPSDRRKEPRKAEPEVNSKTPEAPAAVAKGIYTPTESQADKLRISQLEAVDAQKDWNIASQRLPEYQQFQTKVSKIYADCARIKAENKWPAEVTCNVNVNPITFDKATAAVPVPAAAPPPPSKEKEKDKK
jgi:hypothetical protein